MQTVSADYLTAATATVRKPITEVTIALVDNETLGAGITVTAGEVDSTLNPKETVVDAVKTAPRKMAYTGAHVIPSADLYPMTRRAGWWGDTLADADGYISGGETITLDYNGSVEVLTVNWWADAHLGYPVDWTVEWYDGADWHEIGNETAYTAQSWAYEFSDIATIYKLRMTITRVDRGYTHAKLLELEAGLTVNVSDKVSTWEILKEREHEAETSPVGNVSMNELTLDLDNSDREFFRKADSLYAPYMVANRKITVKCGFELDDGTRELLQQGVFYSTKWKSADNDILAHTHAWDRGKLMKEQTFSTSVVLENYKISELIQYLAEDFGMDSADLLIDDTVETVRYAWFTEASYWYHIRNLAAAVGGYVYFDEYNQLVFHNRDHLATLTSSVATLTDNDSLFALDEDWEENRMRNRIIVPVKPLTAASSQEIYNYTEEFTVPAGETYPLTVIFSTSPCINPATPVVTAGANIGIDSWTAYAWGGLLVLENTGGSDESVTSITIDGQPLENLGGVVVTAYDDTAEKLNGSRVYQVPDEVAQYIQSVAVATPLATALLNAYVNPGNYREGSVRGRPELQLADRLTLQNTKLSLDHDHWLLRARLRYDNSLSMEAAVLEV